MNFGSVCSGIEAASVAWGSIGWEAAWFSEIEPFPCAVLAHHYPSVPNHGDMTLLPNRIRSGEISAPDIFCGGTPCQAFSVAGLRRSLDDDRGNLSLTFCEIANAIDSVRSVRGEPHCIVFWENVPGVLNTPDNAFGCFLAGLAGEDDPLIPSGKKWTNAGCVFGSKRAVAWRVTDAQYFGVAQRRRRVFVVASARDGFDPTKVLFEFNSLRRDTAPSREAGQKPAPTVVSGPPFSRTGNERVECEAIVPAVANCLTSPMHKGINSTVDEGQTPIAVRTANTSANGHGISFGLAHTLDQAQGQAVAQPVAYSIREDAIADNFSATPLEVSTALTVIRQSPQSHHAQVFVAQPIAFAQNTRDEVRLINGDGSIVGALAAQPGMKQTSYVAQPIAFHATQGDGINEEVCFTQNTIDRHAVAQPVCIRESGQGYWMEDDKAGTLRAEGENRPSRPSHVVGQGMAVRRLTPVECERLQGFPDNYTNIPWRNKPEAPDGPRYKALGNSWAVPNVRWIGERIARELSK